MKELSVILFSSFKFAMTFPLAILEYKMGILKTIIWTNIGGFLGIVFFGFLSSQIILLWRKYAIPVLYKSTQHNVERKKRKVFTSKNRRIARIKSRYGLIGIAITTPVLLSIPVGVFIITRYFSRNPYRFLFLIGSNLIWSLIYAFFYTFCWEIYQGLF